MKFLSIGFTSSNKYKFIYQRSQVDAGDNQVESSVDVQQKVVEVKQDFSNERARQGA